MTEVTVSLKDIEALKESLKPGDKVTYFTPVPKFFGEGTERNAQAIHKAIIVKKLQHLAIIEYTAKRGSGTAKTLATMTYKEIYFQRNKYAW